MIISLKSQNHLHFDFTNDGKFIYQLIGKAKMYIDEVNLLVTVGGNFA